MRFILYFFLFLFTGTGILEGRLYASVEADKAPEETILVVVDMQKGFETSSRDEDVVCQVKNLIKESINKKRKIIFLEYEEQGETLDVLRDECLKYDKKFFISKDTDDGSDALLKFFEEKNISKNNLNKIILCGVNTSACVLGTVLGLRSKLSSDITKIVVKGDACNSWDSNLYEQKEAFNKMAELKNVKVKNPHGSLLFKSLKEKYPFLTENLLESLDNNEIDTKSALEFMLHYPEASLDDIIEIEKNHICLLDLVEFNKDFPHMKLKDILNLIDSDSDISYIREQMEREFSR